MKSCLILNKEKHYFQREGKEGFLTKREQECLQWIAEGKTSHEIGIILNISKRTVEEHLKNMKLKLDCYKVQNLVYKALKLGLIY